MQISKKSRRGVTIAELVVVLALLSVVSVMVVSFIMFISHRNRANAANDAVRRDRQMIEAGVESWIKTSMADGADFSVSSEKTTVYSKYGVGEFEKTFNLKFDNGVLCATYPDTEQLQIHTQSVTSIIFYLMTTDTTEDFLLLCTVTSETEDFDGETSYTFCVNPYEGERIGD